MRCLLRQVSCRMGNTHSFPSHPIALFAADVILSSRREPVCPQYSKAILIFSLWTGHGYFKHCNLAPLISCGATRIPTFAAADAVSHLDVAGFCCYWIEVSSFLRKKNARWNRVMLTYAHLSGLLYSLCTALTCAVTPSIHIGPTAS